MGYASGKHAVGQCQRCGDKYKLHVLREDGETNLLVCPTCYDIKHPAEEPVDSTDNVALHRPAPDLDATASRTLTGGSVADELFPGEPIFGGGT